MIQWQEKVRRAVKSREAIWMESEIFMWRLLMQPIL